MLTAFGSMQVEQKPGLVVDSHVFLRRREKQDKITVFYSEHKMEQEAKGHGAAVTVFVHNTYLLPSFMVAITAGNKTCTNQHIRAACIGEEAGGYDVVALQEVWGSQVDKLDCALRPTHDIADGCQSIGSWGLGLGLPSLVDTLRFTYNQNGGLWFAQRKVQPSPRASQTYLLKILCRKSLVSFGGGIRSV
jgi:hypothetical protein